MDPLQCDPRMNSAESSSNGSQHHQQQHKKNSSSQQPELGMAKDISKEEKILIIK